MFLLQGKDEKNLILEESKCDVGPAQARGFFQYLENALTDSRYKEAFLQWAVNNEIYPLETMTKESEAHSRTRIGSMTPLILFCDPTSDFYKVNLKKTKYLWGLVGGMYDLEQQEKHERSVAEIPIRCPVEVRWEQSDVEMKREMSMSISVSV